jgi:hypothetical protein
MGAAVAAVVLLALVWTVALASLQGGGETTYPEVIELSAPDYQRSLAQMTPGHVQELLTAVPIYGQTQIQIWGLLDPITGQEDVRPVLYQHPPEAGQNPIIYRVRVPEGGALGFAIATSPETWTPELGDGTSFQIYVTVPDDPQAGRFVFVRYINPKQNPNDRRWRNFLADLSEWSGQTVDLYLITEAGPARDWRFDWAGWAGLQVVSMEPGVIAASHAKDVVLSHTRSIADWARDETNRDRLAAWSLALRAWQAAPWWGQGLGSTGAAALRTRPDRAFVTESQVLKSLVELGPLGLLTLAYLWVQIGRVGYRAYKVSRDLTHQTLLLGILTSLMVVFIEGWVYQNLEVKQVNAYYWTLVGTLAFLASQQHDAE